MSGWLWLSDGYGLGASLQLGLGLGQMIVTVYFHGQVSGGKYPSFVASLSVVLFCSSAVLDPRIGHTVDVLSPFISVLCHSD